MAAFSKQRGITFPLLSDAGSATIKAYGILNPIPEEALGPGKDDASVSRDVQKYVSVNRVNPVMVGMAFPGTFVIDRQRRVTSRFFEEVYIERNTASSIMLELGVGGSVSGTRVSTAHLEATAYSSDAAIAPGNRFTLALDVTPRPRMHVYAPGASGYRVVSFDVEPQPFVRSLPTTYPLSQIYFFKPLNERVPVFQKRFTLLKEVVVEGNPQAQAALRGKTSLTLRGTLSYQACDDQICFNPVSLPLAWDIALRPLVTERPTVQ